MNGSENFDLLTIYMICHLSSGGRLEDNVLIFPPNVKLCYQLDIFPYDNTLYLPIHINCAPYHHFDGKLTEESILHYEIFKSKMDCYNQVYRRCCRLVHGYWLTLMCYEIISVVEELLANII